MAASQGFYLTAQGKVKYEEDLSSLHRYLHRVIRRMKRLRKRNNLDEDGDWEYTQNEYEYVSKRIDELEDVLVHSQVINRPRGKVVELGCRVRCQSESGVHEFVLVDAPEANPEEGKISVRSILGKELLGKREEDEVDISPPAGHASYKIISVR